MRDLLRLLAISAVAGSALSAQAQQTAPADDTGADVQAPTAEAPAPQAPTAGTLTQDERPQAYVKDVFTDWRVVCVPISETRDSCTMQQLMLDEDENPVSQVSIAPLPPAAAPRAAAVELAVPLETLLSEDLLIRIDTAEPRRYRFSYCTPQACVARFALTREEVAAYKAGGKASVSITPLLAPDQTATVDMSLSGFTAAYDAVAEIMSQ